MVPPPPIDVKKVVREQLVPGAALQRWLPLSFQLASHHSAPVDPNSIRDMQFVDDKRVSQPGYVRTMVAEHASLETHDNRHIASSIILVTAVKGTGIDIA